MQAIKQFTYLFPAYHNKTITVVRAGQTAEWQCPETHLLKEWLTEHYTRINLVAIKGEIIEKLPGFLFGKENIFIIIWAYSNNNITGLFHQSLAEMLVTCTSHPARHVSF